MNTRNCERLCAACIAGDLETIDGILNQEDSLACCRGKVREDHRAYMAGQGAEGGWSPLHLAAFYGQTAAAQRLLDHGAQVDAIGDNAIANTPLHAAIAGGRTECAKIILKYGPDLVLQDGSGMTAHDLAAENGHVEIAVLIEDA